MSKSPVSIAAVCLSITSCDQEAEIPPVSAVASFELPGCEKYTQEPLVEGYCRMVWAPTLESPAQMQESCARAGKWEGPCRAAWLESKMEGSWGAQQSHYAPLWDFE